jgi:tetratricopeptide (TPR) repeat protein
MNLAPLPGLVAALCLSLSLPARADPVGDANAGLQSMKQGDFNSAIRLFTQAIASGALSNDDLEYAYVERGQAYLQENRPDLARADADRALQMKSTDPDAIALESQAAGEAAHAKSGGPEQLVLKPYPATPAWREITNQAEGGGAWIWEFAPASDSGPDYPDIVTAQSFPSARTQDPSAFLRSLFARTATACEQITVNGPVARTEGGLAVAYGQIYCNHQLGQGFGVILAFKAIKGDAALYAINRDLRTPATDVPGVFSFPKDQAGEATAMARAEAVANRYLSDDVYVCGGSASDPRCSGP